MKNQRFIQLIGDIAIPLLGYFWWNWNLYFIVLFFLLDLVFNEIFQWVKAKKIEEAQKIKMDKKSFLSLFLLITVICCAHLFFLSYQPTIDFKQEVLNFLSYKDMGIAQGYILLPLLIFVNYQKYKLEFLVPNLQYKQNLIFLWKTNLSNLLLSVAWFALLIGITRVFTLSDFWVLIIGVSGPAIYQIISILKIQSK